MKFIKLIMVIMAATMITLALGGNALAFHGGGVAHCDGCHTMHNSENGQPVIPGTTAGTGLNSSLTIGTDTSSTCLSCHEGSGGYHIASKAGAANPNLNAAGDFYWLKNDYMVDTGHSTPTYKGEEFGHNIIAADFGYVESTLLTAAPTSTGPNGFPASSLACSSCHDPHGKVYRTSNTYDPIVGSGSYGGNDSRGNPLPLGPGVGVMGNYRLLGSTNYDPDGAISAFSAPAPIAYATNANGYYGSKVDYGSGMSEWCANCHIGFNTTGANAHRHPAANDAHLNGEGTNYNKYVATGDLTGSQATSYLGLVPFERGVLYNETGYVGQLDPEGTTGPDSNSNVMCLTCHRAHANGFKNAGRWDFGTELLAESLPTVGSGNYPYGDQYGYYYGGQRIDIATTFGDGQRSLCNKCHLQD
jgi:hypothetical protein